MKYIRYLIFLHGLLAVIPARAEIPRVLTDTIKGGDGIIDIFKDVSGTELRQYLENGTLFLGVDLNESASGNETSTSAGVAVRDMELLIRTNNGDFTFSEFNTNTTAMIQERGSSEAQEFYTLFGSAGSNQISGTSSGFDLTAFDDIIEIRNITITGEIIGAELSVTFLDTESFGENESFFDYSAGFEEFAILSSPDAKLLDSANIGLGEDAPLSVAYDLAAPSGTPEPAWFFLMIIPAIFLWRKHTSGKAKT